MLRTIRTLGNKKARVYLRLKSHCSLRVARHRSGTGSPHTSPASNGAEGCVPRQGCESPGGSRAARAELYATVQTREGQRENPGGSPREEEDDEGLDGDELDDELAEHDVHMNPHQLARLPWVGGWVGGCTRRWRTVRAARLGSGPTAVHAAEMR